MRPARLVPLLLTTLAGCASATARPEAFPAVEYALVRAVHDDGRDADAASDPRDVLVEIELFTRRVFESNLASLPDLSGLVVAGERSWMAPAPDLADALERAGFERVAMPQLRARPGRDAATFIGETVHRVADADARPVAVGYEAVVCPLPSRAGAVKLAFDVRRRGASGRAPSLAGTPPSTIDLPAGYVAIVRLDPDVTSR